MKKDDIWKYIVYTIGIFIISGISFKIGEIVTSAKEITCKEALESFYYSSWTVYTTIFGLFGIILGVVFPLYQSNRQEKEYKEEMDKVNKKLQELSDVKKDLKEELKNNAIYIEIEKIENEYDIHEDDESRSRVINKFYAFIEKLNYNNALDVLCFLDHVINTIRGKTFPQTSSELASITKEIYFANVSSKAEEQKKIAYKCVIIGNGLVYEACLNPTWINIKANVGLQLLKAINHDARKKDYTDITKKIREGYNDILNEVTKRKPTEEKKIKERKSAIDLLNFLISDLDNDEWGVSFYEKTELEELLKRTD